jgi:uncharacterized phiE125 gp8 family phage protein
VGYGLTLHTAPTAEPVSLDEAKKQCDIADGLTYHDQELMGKIVAARQFVERRLNRQLVTATWNLFLDRFPCGMEPIMVPNAPLQSITSIAYVDSAGDSQTWSASAYRVGVSREPGRVVPVFGGTYPTTLNTIDAVAVRFVAGYGAPAAVPQGIKDAILLLVNHWFTNASPVGTTGSEIAFSLESLLTAYGYGDEFLHFGGQLRHEVYA